MRKSERSHVDRISQLFYSGAEFCRQVQNVIVDLESFVVFLESKKHSKAQATHKEEFKIDKASLTTTAYRYMGLNQGCGREEIKRRFREMVKIIRPDINIDQKTSKKYMALQFARKLLMEEEK